MRESLFRELGVLSSLTDPAGESHGWKRILQTVADAAARAAALDRVAVIEVDRARREVVHVLRAGPGWAEVLATMDYDELSWGLTGWVLETGDVAISPGDVPDPREQPLVRERRRKTHCGSILVAPLGSAPVWGTLTAIGQEGQPDFSLEDIQSFRIFAQVASERLDLLRSRTETDQARQELAASRQSRTNFLANLSHELRTPLNGILGFSHLLGTSALTEAQNTMVQTIASSGQRLLATIDSLLELAQLESGRAPLERSPFSPESVLNAVLAKSRGSAQEKQLTWKVSVSSLVPEILLGDAVRLGLAWSHVVSNAVRFTEQGFVSVELTARPLDAGAVELTLLVEDSGVGMNIGRIDGYLPFRQADWTSARKFGGTGLGLTLSDLIVRQMGGDLELWGQPGLGTKVRMAVQLEPEQSSAPTRKVLVHDPDPSTQVELVRLLEAQGHRVDVAPSVPVTEERLRDSRYDFVLVDAKAMACPEGDSLARAATTLGLPVVGLVEPGGPDTTLGWAALLTKPILAAELDAALRKITPRRIS